MKKPYLFLIIIMSLVIYSCENPTMARLLESKTITFNSNGGSYVPTQTLFKNEKISEPRTPTRAGFYFDGWFTDNYSFLNKWDFNNIPQADMTLHAAWNEKPTPTENDFIIKGAEYVEYDGNPKKVTVTPWEERTTGEITVYYEGGWDTIYTKTTDAPINLGTYIVTFDVAADEKWSAAKGLAAGTLTIIKGNPVASDFDINGDLTQFVTSVNQIAAITFTPKTNKSEGKITVYYEGINGTTFDRSPNKPLKIGSYTVTFDVVADGNWNEASGLEAGTLKINVFENIIELGTWLDEQPENSITNPYPVALNVSDLGGTSNTDGSAGKMLENNSTKYVSLDLSGSTFDFIEAYAFSLCDNLTSVTIPNSVKSIEERAFSSCSYLTSVIIGNQVRFIGNRAFYDCESLTSVMFRGTITQDGWPQNGSDGSYVFPGNLRDAYFGTGSSGIGTYIRSAGGNNWTRQ
jgi:uncharacterized repeat protein (TIGR02543 family)